MQSPEFARMLKSARHVRRAYVCVSYLPTGVLLVNSSAAPGGVVERVAKAVVIGVGMTVLFRGLWAVYAGDSRPSGRRSAEGFVLRIAVWKRLTFQLLMLGPVVGIFGVYFGVNRGEVGGFWVAAGIVVCVALMDWDMAKRICVSQHGLEYLSGPRRGLRVEWAGISAVGVYLQGVEFRDQAGRRHIVMSRVDGYAELAAELLARLKPGSLDPLASEILMHHAARLRDGRSVLGEPKR